MSACLALGTVQFGLPYGVANESGQVGAADARTILAHARAAGVDLLDTAMAYGQSEQVLGEAGIQNWQVVTKLPACPRDCGDVAGWVRHEVAGSRQRLGVEAFHGLLLHRPAQLLEPAGATLYAALRDLKQQGVTARVGISIYSPQELDQLAGRFAFDLVQLPLNILDGRWASTGWLQRLRDQGVEIHARSVFLQGLLLMSKARRPPFFARWEPLWDAWDVWLERCGLTPLAACLRHVMSLPQVDRVVVGVDTLAQWREVVAAARGTAVPAEPAPSTLDATLLNPACWSLN